MQFYIAYQSAAFGQKFKPIDFLVKYTKLYILPFVHHADNERKLNRIIQLFRINKNRYTALYFVPKYYSTIERFITINFDKQD